MSTLGLTPPKSEPVTFLPIRSSYVLRLIGDPCISTPSITVFPHPYFARYKYLDTAIQYKNINHTKIHTYRQIIYFGPKASWFETNLSARAKSILHYGCQTNALKAIVSASISEIINDLINHNEIFVGVLVKYESQIKNTNR